MIDRNVAAGVSEERAESVMKKTRHGYLMENEEEAFRLEIKTDPRAVREQAAWCGVQPGMRVLDLGCGSGKTTSILHSIVGPKGFVLGVDASEERLDFAKRHYGGRQGIEFIRGDLTRPLDIPGGFDIIWVRFILEYFKRESPKIVSRLRPLVEPGGYLCLMDLDGICLNHYELPGTMETILATLASRLDEDYNFDVYAGRKLYSYLYDGKYIDIEMNIVAHHLIYGEARREDLFNWMKKIDVGVERLPCLFDGYPGGAAAFRDDFRTFFSDPRRFTYTPLIMARGMRSYEDRPE